MEKGRCEEGGWKKGGKEGGWTKVRRKEGRKVEQAAGSVNFQNDVTQKSS